MSILFVDVTRGVAEQSDVKMVSIRHTLSDILQASCRHPRVEVLTVTSPAEGIFANATSDPLVQYFIYLIECPVSYSYGSQFLAIKLAVNWCAIKSSSS